MDLFIDCLRQVVEHETTLHCFPDSEEMVSLQKQANECLLDLVPRMIRLYKRLPNWEKLNAQVMARVRLGVDLAGWQP